MKSYIEFANLFGYRVPNKQHAEYYFSLLRESNSYKDLDKQLELWNKYETLDFNKDKFKFIDNVKSYINNKIKESNITYIPEMFKNGFEEKNFISEHNKSYISIDIKEANWSVLKNYFLKDSFPNWYDFIKDLNYDDLFALSKPLRQVIIGQIFNPKTLDRIEKFITYNHIEKLKSLGYSDKIVGVNKDEIILLNENIDCKAIQELEFLLPVSFTFFNVKKVDNFNEHITVYEITDENGNILYKKLYATDGNRFFIHFKTLILNQELNDKDLITRKDNIFFIYHGEDYKKVREYNYIENYTKELEWCEKEYVCGRKMYLSEINGLKYSLEIVLYNDFFKYYVDFNNKNIIQNSIEGNYLDYLDNIKEEIKKHHINYVKQFFI